MCYLWCVCIHSNTGCIIVDFYVLLFLRNYISFHIIFRRILNFHGCYCNVGPNAATQSCLHVNPVMYYKLIIVSLSC